MTELVCVIVNQEYKVFFDSQKRGSNLFLPIFERVRGLPVLQDHVHGEVANLVKIVHKFLVLFSHLDKALLLDQTLIADISILRAGKILSIGVMQLAVQFGSRDFLGCWFLLGHLLLYEVFLDFFHI